MLQYQKSNGFDAFVRLLKSPDIDEVESALTAIEAMAAKSGIYQTFLFSSIETFHSFFFCS